MPVPARHVYSIDRPLCKPHPTAPHIAARQRMLLRTGSRRAVSLSLSLSPPPLLPAARRLATMTGAWPPRHTALVRRADPMRTLVVALHLRRRGDRQGAAAGDGE
jgi:hypothetical protein